MIPHIKDSTVAIIGQGYVGLPLAIAAAENSLSIIGFDTDLNRVLILNQGVSPIADISDSQIKQVLAIQKYRATNNVNEIRSADIFVICVPTPINEDKSPDLSYLNSAIEIVGKNMNKGSLVIVESTISPGTTRDLVLPNLMKFSKFKSEDFYLSFSPERIDPSNQSWNLVKTPKIVAGLNIQSLDKAKSFYSLFIEKIVTVPSLEVAEMAKLLENTFRFVNISFINEMLVICENLGIEIKDVISAASSKPYGFMPFSPGIGIGGHCIPVDPFYLLASVKRVGLSSKFIDAANEVNTVMPVYFADKASKLIQGLADKRIIVLGVAYKPNVSDVRETPVESLIKYLRKSGAIVEWHDEYVKIWKGEKSVELNDKYDLAILATPHNNIELSKLGDVPILYTNRSIS